MSFGKLNILKHKSWNVWNRDNIEKVLKDERLNREDEERKRKRAEEGESEMRVRKLRELKSAANASSSEITAISSRFHRAGEGGSEADSPSAALVAASSTALVATSEETKPKFLNLFEGVEGVIDSAVGNDTATNGGKNKETESEKKKEKDKHERQWGMVGLGQDSFTGDSAAVKPWYAVTQDPRKATYEGPYQAATLHGSVPFGMDNGKAEKEAREAKKKRRSDPMSEMTQYLEKARDHKEKKKSHKHGRERERGRGGEADEAEKAAKLAKMRLDRVAREQAERERVAAIMGGPTPRGYLDAARGGGARGERGDEPRGGYAGGYNSGFAQFHGGIVREKGPGGPRFGGR